MHDLRFYVRYRQVTLGDLADLTGSVLIGNPTHNVVTLSASENAEQGAICFFEGRPQQAGDISASATACFVKDDSVSYLPEGVNAVICTNPRYSFFKAAQAFLSVRKVGYAHDDLGPARIAGSAHIGPFTVISDGVEIGENCEIGPNVVIGPGVRIGRNTQIHSGVVIENALIGNDVLIKANTVIGGSGFGIISSAEGLELSPHYGRVVVQDFVTVGSNCCIDRGVFGDTVIGERSHIDNLVQIGHNVEIGRNCILAAFCGISGSVKIGDGVRMGGRVGVADHVIIEDHVSLAANTALMRSVPAGETWGGAPGKPLKHWMREVAWLTKNAGTGRKNR